MHLFVPYHDPSYGAAALRMACRMTLPGDTITVLITTVIAPYTSWGRGMRATDAVCEQRDGWRSQIEAARGWRSPEGVTFHRERVHCRDVASVVVARAVACGAGAILLDAADPLRHHFTARLGTTRVIVRRAPGNTRVLSYTVPPPISPDRSLPPPSGANTLSAFMV